MLFTRDLRVHDHPALLAAAAADRVVAMFVFDATILASSFAAPNRVAFLLESVTALRQSLADRGGSLVVRHGQVTAEVADVVAETGASVLHVTADVSAYARRRAASLRAAMAARGVDVQVHPGHLLVEPGQVTPVGGDHYKVFTPYWRRWREAGRRAPLPAPTRLSSPPIHAGAMPTLDELTSGPCSPDRQTGGAPAARARLDAWLDGPIAEYESARDDLANPAGTSRLSADLHFGTISVAEIADRLDLRRRGHAPFLRQLCWRDFNHQLLAAVPSLPTRDYRTRGDDWHDDPEGLQAWRDGTTGYPVVDAGMRQLRREGYLHNRARMIVASFLTKHLYIDWRRGAAHFCDWLTDGDLGTCQALGDKFFENLVSRLLGAFGVVDGPVDPARG